MALLDRGDTYRVGFLGSAMMSQLGTGVGVLQKPLRQLYFPARQPNGETRGQERYLLMSRQGLTITFKDSPTSAPQEVFYDMPSIVFWDAVQFVTVRADKKLKGAFEPLDDNHSRHKDNIFTLVEKKYHYMAQITHPPLFTCVLRRTSGVKALDVHAFVCSTDEEALSLLRTLNVVQRLYKSGEVHGTGVFEYSPFGEQASPTVPGTGMAAVAVFPPISPSSPGDNVTRNVQSADPSRRQHVQQQQQMAGNVQSADGAHQVYKLKQEDFVVTGGLNSADSGVVDRRYYIDNPERAEILHHQVRGQGQNFRSRGPSGGHDGEEVYSSVIENDNNARPTRVQPSESFTKKIEYQSITRHLNLFEDTLNPGVPRNYGSYQQNNSVVGHQLSPAYGDRQSRTSSTGSGQGSSPTAKLGQGYSLLTGSQSPIPGQNTPRYVDEEVERKPEWGRERSRYHGVSQDSYNQSPRSRFSGSNASTPPPSPERPANHTNESNIPQQGHYDVPKRRYFMDFDGSVEVFDRTEQTPASETGRVSVSELKQKIQEQANLTQQNSFGEADVDKLSENRGLYDIPKNPPRPVAKVHPHKIQGIRVLPTDPGDLQIPLKSPGVSEPSNNARPKSMGFLDSSVDYDQNPKFDNAHQQIRSLNKKTPNERPKSRNFELDDKAHVKTPQSNWQFKSVSSADVNYQTNDDAKASDPSVNDKLLLSQKKDAEIASVLQNLTFDPSPRLASSGPSGTDFERSLGYLP